MNNTFWNAIETKIHSILPYIQLQMMNQQWTKFIPRSFRDIVKRFSSKIINLLVKKKCMTSFFNLTESFKKCALYNWDMCLHSQHWVYTNWNFRKNRDNILVGSIGVDWKFITARHTPLYKHSALTCYSVWRIWMRVYTQIYMHL